MQGEHGTLTGTADKHQHQSRGKHKAALSKTCLVELETEGAAVEPVDEDTDKEEHIGEARHDKGFLGSRDGCRRSEVEANEQIGRNAYQFPEEVHLENICGNYEAEHRHREEAEKSVITLETALAVHIAEGVYVDHERHGGDDNQHHHGYRVEHDAHVEVQAFNEEGQPREVVGHKRGKHALGSPFGLEEILEGYAVRKRGDCEQTAGADKPCHFVAEPFSANSQYEEGEERYQQNQK